MTRGVALGRRALLAAALGWVVALPGWPAAAQGQPRRFPFGVRATILYGMFRFEEQGLVEEWVDRAAGRYQARLRATGPEVSTDVDSEGVLREGRWAPTRFQDRVVVYGRESRLDIAYDHERRQVHYRGRSETFVLRRLRVVDDVVPIPPGLHVDDALSATLNYADDRWPREPDGTLLTRVVRRRRGGQEGPEDVERSYRAELVPFALRPGAAEGGRTTATFDMTRFSSWAREEEPGRITFGPYRRPETISATLALGTSITIRIGAAAGQLPGGGPAAGSVGPPGGRRARG